MDWIEVRDGLNLAWQLADGMSGAERPAPAVSPFKSNWWTARFLRGAGAGPTSGSSSVRPHSGERAGSTQRHAYERGQSCDGVVADAVGQSPG